MTPPGMNFYKPMSGVNSDGASVLKSVKVASFSSDFVGLKRFAMNFHSGACEIEFQDNPLIADQYAVTNKKGELVGILTRGQQPGIYTATVITAYGDAIAGVTKEIAAGVTGAVLATVTPVALGNGFSAIPTK